MNEDFNYQSEEEKIDANVEEQMNSEYETENTPKEHMGQYLFYAFMLVAVLITFGITGTYAYYNVTANNTSQTTTVSSSVECFSTTLSQTAAYSLTYNYPITDAFATGNISPYTVTLKNNCATGSAIPFSLYFATLDGASSTIPDSKMKILIKKNDANMKDTGILNTQYPVDTSVAANIKTTVEGKDATFKTNGKYHLIESGNLAANTTITYKLYIWVDYNEGGTNNSTEGLSFKTIVAAGINQ